MSDTENNLEMLSTYVGAYVNAYRDLFITLRLIDAYNKQFNKVNIKNNNNNDNDKSINLVIKEEICP